MKNATLRIDGMHCDGCAAIVRSLLERQAGVQAVRVSYADGLAQVLFDPQTISDLALVTVMENAGYRVTSRATSARVS